MRRLLAGLHSLLRRRQVEQDLDDELRAYLEAAVDQNLASGMSRDEASERRASASAPLKRQRTPFAMLGGNRDSRVSGRTFVMRSEDYGDHQASPQPRSSRSRSVSARTPRSSRS